MKNWLIRGYGFVIDRKIKYGGSFTDENHENFSFTNTHRLMNSFTHEYRVNKKGKKKLRLRAEQMWELELGIEHRFIIVSHLKNIQPFILKLYYRVHNVALISEKNLLLLPNDFPDFFPLEHYYNIIKSYLSSLFYDFWKHVQSLWKI